MFWIVQNNIYSEDGWEKLIEALERLNVKHSVHKVVPFSGTLDPTPAPTPGPVVVMGSYTLARIAKEQGWSPGAFVSDNLDYEVQQAHWGIYMFNFGAWVGALKDVEPQTHPFFIRPTTDSKSFSGFVTDWPEFEKWRVNTLDLAKDGYITVTGETRVMVSRKYEIAREYRTWIVDKKVVTASLYKTGSHKYYRPEVDERIINFAEKMASYYTPARAFVLDVFESIIDARTGRTGELYIGEVNCLNASGFYAADVQKLVAAIEEMKGF